MLRVQRVDSTSIDYVAYDDQTRKLFVRFRETKELYAYHDVPPSIYVGLLTSDSHGHYLNYEVKGSYDFTKVERHPRPAVDR